MTRPSLIFTALYLVAAAIILWTLFSLVAMRDVWTDPLYTTSDRAIMALKSMFWLALAGGIMFATQKRSQWVLALVLLALGYLVVSSLLTIVPLAQFYLFNTSGSSGYRILAAVAAPHVAQIAVAVALGLGCLHLRKTGHIS